MPVGGYSSGVNLPLTNIQQAALNIGSPNLLPRTRGMFGRVAAGNGNGLITCIGDSTTFGSYSLNADTGDLVKLSYPSFLTSMIKNQKGVNSNRNAFMGNGNNSTEINSNNNGMITVGSGWGYLSTGTVGGEQWRAAGTTGNLAFTPSTNVDTFVIWYQTYVTNGSFSFNINGGTNTIQSTTVATSILSVTTTATLGTNTLNINWSSGGAIQIMGVIAYNSALSEVTVLNAGWSGSVTSNWTGAGASISDLNPDLVLICLGMNDWRTSVTPATYTTNLQSIISGITNGADIALVSPVPSNTTVTPSVNQKAIVAAMSALAVTNNCLYIDNYDRWVSYAVANADGLYAVAGGGINPIANGYYDFAQGVFEAINV